MTSCDQLTLTLPISVHALGTILFVAAVVGLSVLVHLATRQYRPAAESG